MSDWRKKWEDDLKSARAHVREVQSGHHRYAFLVRACEESGVGDLVSGITVFPSGSSFINLVGVGDFALVAPLLAWLEEHGRQPKRAPEDDGGARTWALLDNAAGPYKTLFVVAKPPREGEVEVDTKCRSVKIRDEWITPEPYKSPVYKIVCDEEMV